MKLSATKKDQILKTAVPSLGVYAIETLPDSYVLTCMVEMTVAEFKAAKPTIMEVLQDNGH